MSQYNSKTETTACQKFAALADQLARQQPNLSPKEFILKLGEQAAGIRRGLPGILDLLKGGKNLLPGGGFKPEYDDNSGGQVRHFVGITVSSIYFGSKPTVWLSETVRRDPPDTPDGRLTVTAVEFSQKLLKGEIPLASAGQWLRENICQPQG